VDDLTAWLHEQIDEDERVIRLACTYSHETFVRSGADKWTLQRDQEKPDARVLVWASIGPLRPHFTEITVPVSSNMGQFLERFDPRRALAECEAKRRVVRLYENAARALHAGSMSERNRTQDEAAVDVLGAAVRALAESYAQLAGYRPEWSPDAD